VDRFTLSSEKRRGGGLPGALAQGRGILPTYSPTFGWRLEAKVPAS